MTLNELLFYSTPALIIILNAIGVGIGQGLVGITALNAMNTQPHAQDDIKRATFLSMALIETASVIGSIAAVMLLFSQEVSHGFPTTLAHLGIACALGLSGITTSIMSSFPARAAIDAIARQPFFGQKITRLMLLTLSMIQTPVIFGFIIRIIIQTQLSDIHSLSDGVRLFSAGLALGLGSIGPVIGLALLAQAACKGIGINKNSYNKVILFTFIGGAIIETSIIIAFVIAILLLYTLASPLDNETLNIARYLGAAICVGIGTFGTGISSGITATAACQQIALNPNLYSAISRVYFPAQGIIETCTLFSMLIALGLLFS